MGASVILAAVLESLVGIARLGKLAEYVEVYFYAFPILSSFQLSLRSLSLLLFNDRFSCFMEETLSGNVLSMSM
jgi:hypothetical protein